MTDVAVSKNRLLALGTVSAAMPGVGHFFSGRKRSAIVFFSLFVVLLLTFGVARAPAFYTWLWSIDVLLIILCLAASWNCLFGISTGAEKVSRFWFLLPVITVILTSHLTLQLVLVAAGFRTFSIPSSSMEPTVRASESLMADMRFYQKRKPFKGDLVLVQNDQGILLLKRIAATSGETVSVVSGQLLVNGEPVGDPITAMSNGPPELSNFGPVTLPENEIFLLGDNRATSFDSRFKEFGRFTYDRIKGRPLYIIKSESFSRIGATLR